MRVLLDSCVWGGAVAVIRDAGHDCLWVGEWPEDPGDSEILDRAHQDGRVLVTLDKDFGELAVVRRVPHSGIVRLVGFPARRQGEVCCEVLDRYASELGAGALVTVTPQRSRIRVDED